MTPFSFLKRCPECKNKLEQGANFCSCGAPVRDFRRTCHHCHRIVDAQAERCAHCSALLGEVEPRYVLIRWARRRHEFARRIDVVAFTEGDEVISDPGAALQGALDGGVTVEAGTKALLFVNGSLEKVLEPGWTSTTSDALSVYAGEEYVHTLTVIAVDASDTELAWRFPLALNANTDAGKENSSAMALVTKDGFRVAARLGLTVSLADPAALASNLLKEQVSITAGGLAAWLSPTMDAVVREIVGQTDSADLRSPDSVWRRQLEGLLRERLQRDLEVAGLRMERLRGFGLESPRLKELEEDRELTAVIRDKAGEARTRLEHIENLQDALVQKRRLDDKARLEIEKSGILTDAEIAELNRHAQDEEFGWKHAREILSVKHAAEVEEIGKRASLKLYVERQEEDIRLEDKRKTLQLDREERERDHEANVALKMIEAKQRHKLDQIQVFKDWDDPEKILTVLAGISPDAAEALRAKYERANADDRVELLKEMQGEMSKIQQSAMSGMADVAAAKATTQLVSCPHCSIHLSVGVAECPSCKKPVK
jgi:hypothetical protein